MKKLLLASLAGILAVSMLTSCGSSRKTGCPAVAKAQPAAKQVQS